MKCSGFNQASYIVTTSPTINVHNNQDTMKVLILLAIIGFVAVQVSEARMSAFACADCFSYDSGPFCISNGSVVCDNCVRDSMLCDDTSLTSNDCQSSCDPGTEIAK